jgi:hypothetical protein
MKAASQVILAVVSSAVLALACAAPPADPTSTAAQPEPSTRTSPLPATTAEQSVSSGSDVLERGNYGSANNARLAALVPAGMTSRDACNGFSNVNVCAATLHASRNLKISFTELKSKVAAGQRLGAAIHTLRPSADAKAEERRAEDQATADLQAPRG